MASLFRPVSVQKIPKNATLYATPAGVPMARWKARGGKVHSGEVTESGKVRVVSPTWWIEYQDKAGNRRRVAGSPDRVATEHQMAELIRDVNREKGGLLPRTAVVTGQTILSLAAEYRGHLKDLGRTPKHFNDTYAQIRDLALGCSWVTLDDVDLGKWTRWVGVQRQPGGLSSETINHYLRSFRSLLYYLLASHRLGFNPLAGAVLLNPDADRRIIRRVLPPETFRQLIDSTRAAKKKRVYLDGPGRAALYLIAARTGFRGVLAKMEKSDVRLDDATPHIPTSAKTQKSRKALAIPLTAAVVAEIRAWLEARPPGLLWPGNWHAHNKAASMLRRDLRAAGIPEETEDGTYDFHALRGQCATDLALAGVDLHVTQQFLGHSTPTLTSKHYVRIGLLDLAKAAGKVSG